jgi:hydroxyethylthiazole kinase-like uncharacterized protein yjeF
MSLNTLPDQQTIEPAQFPEVFSKRAPNSHKGSFGSVGLIGGADGMTGAIILAGRAALKAGAGKVFVGFAQEELPLPYDPLMPELMLKPAQVLLHEAKNITAWAIGCGLGELPTSQRLLRELFINRKGAALVIDADALNALAHESVAPTWGAGVVVLTPHPAEAARLLNTTTAIIQNDRPVAARTLAKLYRCWVVLKGSGTVVCAPDLTWQLNVNGNVGLATGGTGDVLAGVIASLLAQGITTPQAICAAVWLHAAAADLLVRNGLGPIGMTASDLLNAIRDLRNQGQLSSVQV